MNKYFLQYDETDCGAAALATTLSILKNKISLFEVKNRINKTIYGSSIQDIIDAANLFDIKAEGLNGDIDELQTAIKNKEISFPFIAHIEKLDGMAHFVVVTKISRGKVFIFDPSSGKTIKSIVNFENSWTHNIIVFDSSQQKQKVYAKVSLDLLFQLIEPYKKKLTTVSILILLISLMSIIGAKSYQIIIDNFASVESSNVNLFRVVTLNKNSFFILLIVFYLFKNTLNYFTGLLLNDMDMISQKKLRKDFLVKFFSLQVPFINSKKSGDSLTRLGDLENISMFFSKILTKFLSDFIMILVGGIALLSINKQLFLIVMIIIGLYSVVAFIIIPKFKKKQRELMEYDANVMSKFSESISLIELIKTAQIEERFLSKLLETSDKFIKSRKAYGILENTFSFLVSNIQEIGMLIVLWVGINQISNNNLTLGELIAFESLMGLFITPIMNLFSLQKEYQQFIVSFERVLEYEKAKSETYGLSSSLSRYDVVLDNLGFSYGNSTILAEVSFVIKEGEKIFIQGGNGSGKSTFFKLLDKINIEYKGSIKIGNKELNDFSVNDIRNIVEYTPSDYSVFSGTLYENIVTNNDDKQPNIQILNNLINSGILNNLLNSLGMGLDSLIYENGINLSEGQKQIISFCRTLVSNKKIMIFDEKTSHIDKETEEKLLNFAFDNFKETTFIFTSHNGDIREKCDKEIKINAAKFLNNGGGIK